MRIISATVLLFALVAIALPQTALAAEDKYANETKIKLKIELNGVTSNDLFPKDQNMLAYDPHNFKNTIDLVQIDPERARILEKYENKIKLANLPKGQFTINASAYTAAADECGKSDGITASGLMVKENETIACPKEFPLGTKIKIEGMGVYICQDRGGAIKGNHIDIYMETKTEAFAFGRRNLLAQVVR